MRLFPRSVFSFVQLVSLSQGGKERKIKDTWNKTVFPAPPLELETTAHASPSFTVHSTDLREGGVDGLAPKGYMFAFGM